MALPTMLKWDRSLAVLRRIISRLSKTSIIWTEGRIDKRVEVQTKLLHLQDHNQRKRRHHILKFFQENDFQLTSLSVCLSPSSNLKISAHSIEILIYPSTTSYRSDDGSFLAFDMNVCSPAGNKTSNKWPNERPDRWMDGEITEFIN